VWTPLCGRRRRPRLAGVASDRPPGEGRRERVRLRAGHPHARALVRRAA